MIHFVHLAALAVVAWQTPATPPAKLPVTRIRLKHIKPSEAKQILFLSYQTNWWDLPWHNTNSDSEPPKYPPGVQYIAAYDVDNSLIVRGTPEGAAKVQNMAARIDYVHPIQTLWMRVKLSPVLKDVSTAESNLHHTSTVDLAAFGKRIDHTWNADEFVADSLSIAPNAYGYALDRNPMSGNIRWPPDLDETYLYVRFHLGAQNSVDVLAELCYRDASNVLQSVQKKVLGVVRRNSALMVFPIPDPKYPVEYYVAEITPGVRRPPDPIGPRYFPATTLANWQ